jgi:hypothetical protein
MYVDSKGIIDDLKQ